MRMVMAMRLVVSLLVGGAALAHDALPEKQLHGGTLVIQGARYTVTLPGGETVKGMQKLHPAQGAKAIDIINSSGPNKGKVSHGIYELNGDAFRVVFAPPGESRPTKFVTAPDSGRWFHF
jgi:uncharacterized protein (TIGR03067 family)